MRLRKIFSALLAAVMCIALAGTVCADSSSYWQDAREISGAKYYPSLMKVAEKYYNKEQSHTITYGKSMTKKFYTKLDNAAHTQEPEYTLSLCGGDAVEFLAVRDGDIKWVVSCDTCVLALSVDKDSITSIVNNIGTVRAGYMVTPNDGSFTGDSVLAMFDGMRIGHSYPDDTVGKYFKIRYKEKIYYYEEFGGEGLLFTEKGTPAVLVGNTAACSGYFTQYDGNTAALSVYFSANVKDSDFEFNIPESYVEKKE